MVRDVCLLCFNVLPMGFLVPFLIMGRVTYIHHYVRSHLTPFTLIP